MTKKITKRQFVIISKLTTNWKELSKKRNFEQFSNSCLAHLDIAPAIWSAKNEVRHRILPRVGVDEGVEEQPCAGVGGHLARAWRSSRIRSGAAADVVNYARRCN